MHAVDAGIADVGCWLPGLRRDLRGRRDVLRILAGELSPSGIRVICLRPDAIPEAVAGTLLGRLPTFTEVASFAAFVASDRAGAMTGAIANLTCGSLVD
jgi:3-oxoacyl-[acyl-carrier protein] reductase